jgi:hypothetical protein
MESEQESFLKDLDIKTDTVLDTPLTEAEPEKESAEEDEVKLKNRRERRLVEKWQSERESSIALAARLEALTESQTLRKDADVADYLKKAEKIYGNATPEGREATELLMEALKGVEASATQKAYEALSAEKENEDGAVRKEESTLDDTADYWEDEYGIDMSNEADRKGIFSLLERTSPKDRDGNIVEYADRDAVAELYLSRKERSSRAKELASRSMTRSGQSQGSQLTTDSQERFLRENGII